MKYTKEFKEEVVRMSVKIGVKKTAEQLGQHYNMLPSTTLPTVRCSVSFLVNSIHQKYYKIAAIR